MRWGGFRSWDRVITVDADGDAMAPELISAEVDVFGDGFAGDDKDIGLTGRGKRGDAQEASHCWKYFIVENITTDKK